MDSLIHFHEELVMDIFSRLPARSLLQCKCVSKYWKALICDPYFTKKHLNRAKNKLACRKFIGSQLYLNDDNMLSYYCSSISSPELVEYVQKLDCPAISKPSPCRIYCYRDGLSLIGVRYDKHLTLLLWNPTTRESVVLPHPEFPVIEEFSTFGLGYDSTSDDYKILKIDPKVRGEILALKSGSWRKIDAHPNGINPVLSGMDPLAFVHGAFHWLGLSYDSVVSFNISNETYGEIPLPDRMCLNSNKACIERGISVLEGKLCGYYIGNYEGKECFSAWVMKDYGIKESCHGLFLIQCTDIYHAIPYYKYADAELLIYCMGPKRFYSVLRTSRGPFGLWTQGYSFREGFVFTESLISPKLNYA